MSAPLILPPDLERELAGVDTVIEQAIAAGDPRIATRYANGLVQTARLKGTALAKLCYGLRENWSTFQVAGIHEEWDDYLSANLIALNPENVRKYASMWERVFVLAPISEDTWGHLVTAPVEKLLLVSAAVGEGQLREEQLEMIPHQSIDATRKMVKDARGLHTSATRDILSAVLVMKEGVGFIKGSLYAKLGDEREVIALVKLDPDTEGGKMLLERLKHALHVFEKG